MSNLNWRRSELEAQATAEGGMKLETAGKWTIQQYLLAGMVTDERAAEFGVRADRVYCPECGRELPEDTTGCPVHGQWW